MNYHRPRLSPGNICKINKRKKLVTIFASEKEVEDLIEKSNVYWPCVDLDREKNGRLIIDDMVYGVRFQVRLRK